MSRYLLTVDAERDIDLIKDYLLLQGGTGLARHVLGHIQRGMELIGDNPGIGHVRDDLTDQPVRFWAVFSYLIIYDPVPRPVQVVRVLHGARDLANLLGST